MYHPADKTRGREEVEIPKESYRVGEGEAGERLDVFLPRQDPAFSRSQVAKLIDSQLVTVNDQIVKRSYRVRLGDVVQVHLVPQETSLLSPEPIELTIVYEDEQVIVLDKPAGLVVHPGAGNKAGTLVHGLLYHCKHLAAVGDRSRPGIVHRLDKDTSGLMVIAKTPESHRVLSLQFKERQVEKVYLAFVYGEPTEEQGEIVLPIGRHPYLRQQMSTQSRRQRDAVTAWEVVQRFSPLATFLRIRLHTGRTHQIRVHLDAIGYPVIGDPIYGRGKVARQRGEGILKGVMTVPRRQLLHAHTLSFVHPMTGRRELFTSPLPADMTSFYEKLKELTHV